jgi:hypothetical protein
MPFHKYYNKYALAKGTRVGGGRAPPVNYFTHPLAHTHRHCLILVLLFDKRRNNQIILTTADSTVHPAEDQGYNREVPGRTESGAFSQQVLFTKNPNA